MRLREITYKDNNQVETLVGRNANAAGKRMGGTLAKMAAKTGQGAKMAAQKMGAKGSGGMMAKGLDKLASGGALTGNLSKQIAPFAKQLSTILADTQLRNKFMMLVKQAEAGAKKQAPAQPQAGQPQMQTQSMEEDPFNDEVKNILKKHPEATAKMKATGDVNDIYNTDLYMDLYTHYQQDMPYGTQKARDGDPVQFIQDELDELGIFDDEQMGEAATPGATSAGAIATVANPITAYAKVKRDGKGVPKADQKKTPKGTAVNALDMKGASLFGGNIQKR
tara:strand:+ start:5000 stop:5836 length:837 start_codon:yes stop_codon:yes gene_type:complete